MIEHVQNIFNRVIAFMERDWLDDIKKYYLDINPVYRHSFWILFVVTNIVFGFHTINFLWGNHDWGIMVKGHPWNASFHEGRYVGFVMSHILTGKMYLPIISALWAYAALSISAILLAVYWKITKKVSYFVIFGLILNITPYTISWLWYNHWTVNIFFGRLFIICGLILSDKFSTRTTKYKLWCGVLATLLVNFGIGTYQSLIGTIAIAFIGRILIEMLDWSSLKEGFIKTTKQNIFTAINIIFAGVVYKIIFEYMKYKEAINNTFYNLQTVSLTELPTKIIKSSKGALQQFTDFSIPFYPDVLTKLFFVLAMIFIVQIILSKKSVIIKTFICITFILSLFATKIVAIVSYSDTVHTVRIDFCGYVLFNALIVTLCLKIGGITQNIKILISCLIIYIFAINDLHQQRTWNLAFNAEQMLLNRVLERIEVQQSRNDYDMYEYIQLGEWPSYRKSFYIPRQNEFKNKELLEYSMTPPWYPYTSILFYSKDIHLKGKYPANSFKNKKFMSALKRIYDAGLLENAKAWPAENSIIVYEDIILVIMNEYDLQKAKQLLTEQAKNEQVQEDKAKSAETSQPQVEAE